MKKSIIAGISGGSDSIALLDTLYQNGKFTIIVCHVNYHFRPESNYDQKIVQEYCEKKNITINILNVNDSILKKYAHFKNKQWIAREIRFDFFEENAKKYNTNILFLAHHKDDFIETAIMQEDRSTDLYFYGIKEKTQYKGLTILRPLLTQYKYELISYCKVNKLNFAIDVTNFQPIYERNRIREELSKKSPLEKDRIYDHYKKINQSHEKINKKIENTFNSWEETNFSYDFYLAQEDKIKQNLLFKYLIVNDFFIKVNKNKINGMMEFLLKGDFKKSYRLTEILFFTVKENKFFIEEV